LLDIFLSYIHALPTPHVLSLAPAKSRLTTSTDIMLLRMRLLLRNFRPRIMSFRTTCTVLFSYRLPRRVALLPSHRRHVLLTNTTSNGCSTPLLFWTLSIVQCSKWIHYVSDAGQLQSSDENICFDESRDWDYSRTQKNRYFHMKTEAETASETYSL
jgi:hypothetical protein